MFELLIVAAFFYLFVRLNRLEERLREPRDGAVPKPSHTEEQREHSHITDVRPQHYEKEPLPEPDTGEQVHHTVPKNDTGTEFALGSKVFTGVGIFAVLLGVGFFLRYAFENNLINEITRLVLGGIAGILFMGLGHWLRKKYQTYGSVLVGGGLGILYLVLYAAYNVYTLVSQTQAFIGMIIVTCAGVTLALLYNSLPLIGFAFLGGFLTPMLLPSSTPNPFVLFTYITILDIGVLAVAWKKHWPQLTLGSFVGTVLLYAVWFDKFFDTADLWTGFIYTSVFFILFFVANIVGHMVREGLSERVHDRNEREIDFFLMVTIPLFYFVTNFMPFSESFPDTVAWFPFLLGLFYALCGGLASRVLARTELRETIQHIRQFTLVIAGVFFAIAVVVFFDGKLVTMLWALLAMLMVWVGIVSHSVWNRVLGLLLLVCSGFRLFFFEPDLALEGVVPLFNERALVFGVFVIIGAVVWWLYKKHTEDGQVEERALGRYLGILSFFIPVILWVSLEISDFGERDYMPIAWLVLVALSVGLSYMIRERLLRYIGYALLVISVGSIGFMYWIFDGLFRSSDYTAFFNIRVFATLVAVAVCVLVVHLVGRFRVQVSEREYTTTRGLAVLGINALLLWVMSVEIVEFFDTKIAKQYQVINEIPTNGSRSSFAAFENMKRVVFSGAWLIYASIVLVLGIVERSKYMRKGALILFGFVIFKVFLYDTANLSDIYRFVSFISLGVILLIAGFLYYKFKYRIEGFMQWEEGSSA